MIQLKPDVEEQLMTCWHLLPKNPPAHLLLELQDGFHVYTESGSFTKNDRKDKV